MLKGLTDIFNSTLSNEIQDNLVEFFDWGFMLKGNYFNVTIGEESPDGYDYSLLQISDNTNYTPGQAWEGFRKNWIWQSGITHSPAPITGSNNTIPGISGVYVDDVFYPSDTTGDYAHNVDYFNGRIVFDSPIPTGSKVQAEFSYKYINFLYANNFPWLREVQYRSLDKTSNNSNYEIPSEMKVQLPAIAIEVVPARTFKPYQFGGGQWIYTDVLFHCIAEDSFTRNKMVDIISYQNDKQFCFFSSDKIASSGAFPLNYLGYPNSGALRYPDLVSNYTGITVRLKNTTIQNMEILNSSLYGGIVRTTVENISTLI